MTVVKQITNGELKTFKSVTVLSNGYSSNLQVSDIKEIVIYSSGLIEVIEISGNIRFYSSADVLIKK